jgi:hypothetical protein
MYLKKNEQRSKKPQRLNYQQDTTNKSFAEIQAGTTQTILMNKPPELSSDHD